MWMKRHEFLFTLDCLRITAAGLADTAGVTQHALENEARIIISQITIKGQVGNIIMRPIAKIVIVLVSGECQGSQGLSMISVG